jgi:hypothetical protein
MHMVAATWHSPSSLQAEFSTSCYRFFRLLLEALSKKGSLRAENIVNSSDRCLKT